MFKEAESRPDKIESTSNNVQARKKQQHRRRACDLLASLKRFYCFFCSPLVKICVSVAPYLAKAMRFLKRYLIMNFYWLKTITHFLKILLCSNLYSILGLIIDGIDTNI